MSLPFARGICVAFMLSQILASYVVGQDSARCEKTTCEKVCSEKAIRDQDRCENTWCEKTRCEKGRCAGEVAAGAASCSIFAKACDGCTRISDFGVLPLPITIEEETVEVGVPLISKVPYISRLFKNSGIQKNLVVTTAGECSDNCSGCELARRVCERKACDSLDVFVEAKCQCKDGDQACDCGDSCKCSSTQATLLPATVRSQRCTTQPSDCVTVSEWLSRPTCRPSESKLCESKPCESKPCESKPTAPSAPLDRTAHLRRAAEHLAAAGRTDLAREIRNEVALEAKLQELQKLQAEINQLRRSVTGEQTVILRMKVLELQTSKMRQLGFDFQTANGEVAGRSQQTASFFLSDAPNAIDGFIAALKEKGLVKVLAEPTLATVSGRPASFRSGGEFPILVPQREGAVAVEYREFGTRVDCLPIVLGNGNIRLELRPTISEIDPSRAITINDSAVPALRTRTIDTAVEMQAGQTVVLGGLVQKCSSTSDACVNADETALVVTVTAELAEAQAQASKEDQVSYR